MRLVREWFPFEVLHFPIRDASASWSASSSVAARRSPDGRAHRRAALDRLARGEGATPALARDASSTTSALGAGWRDGSLRRSTTRLRDALRDDRRRASASPAGAPTLADDADLAEDVAGRARARLRGRCSSGACAELERASPCSEPSEPRRRRVVRRRRAAVGRRRVAPATIPRARGRARLARAPGPTDRWIHDRRPRHADPPRAAERAPRLPASSGAPATWR